MHNIPKPTLKNSKLPNPPHIAGAHGKAWKFDLDAVAAKRGKHTHTSLDSYLIYAPWAHPLWHSYSLMLIHLRTLPGLPPPRIYRTGATHETMLFAMDPGWDMDITEAPGPYCLHPINFGAQLLAESDQAACDLMRKTVLEVVNGALSPDTDYMQHWIARFGASMIKGDPARAGETIITLDTPEKKERMVIDPAPLDKKPTVTPVP